MSFDSFFNFCSYVLAYEQQLVRAGWGVGWGSCVYCCDKALSSFVSLLQLWHDALCGFVNDKIAS